MLRLTVLYELLKTIDQFLRSFANVTVGRIVRVTQDNYQFLSRSFAIVTADRNKDKTFADKMVDSLE